MDRLDYDIFREIDGITDNDCGYTLDSIRKKEQVVVLRKKVSSTNELFLEVNVREMSYSKRKFTPQIGRCTCGDFSIKEIEMLSAIVDIMNKNKYGQVERKVYEK